METPPNIPRSCETCLYMRVHDKCDNCLGNGPQYEYRNWQAATFGEALALEHERQVSGARNIVISGSGEAEVNAKWTVKEAYEHLVHVSEACGYMTYSPKFSGDEAALRVLVNGEHFVIWKGGVLDRIEDRSGRCSWSRHPDFLKVSYPKDWLEAYGLPRQRQRPLNSVANQNGSTMDPQRI